MTRRTRGEPLGCDAPATVNTRAKVRAKRRPAKVTTWRGWGVKLAEADCPLLCGDRDHAADVASRCRGARRVRVVVTWGDGRR